MVEWFSFECRKTKTKVITLANHIGHRQYIEPIKTRSNYMWLTQSAGKSCERVTIGFGFTSDWMKRWRESFKPIASCRKCKTNYFSTLKWKPLYMVKIPSRIRSSGKIAVRGLWVPQNKNDLMNNFLHDIVIRVGKGKYLLSSVNSVSTFWIWPWPSFSLENPLYFLKVGIVWRARKIVLSVRQFRSELKGLIVKKRTRTREHELIKPFNF